MRKFLFLAVMLAFAGLTNAQQKMETKSKTTLERPDIKNNFDNWSEELKLTDAQKSKIKAINEKYTKEATAIRSSGTAADFKNLNDRKQKEIDAILTSDQHKKVKEIQQRRDQEKLQKASLKPSK